MGKPTGFLEYKRETAIRSRSRKGTNQPILRNSMTPLSARKTDRCREHDVWHCGVPFCQAGMMIGGMASGCPLHNLVPECE